jgi:FkbM family methyltransferase
MISYAQNGEDVLLARLFGSQPTGRYIDVGAGHPVEDSVTKHFYDVGWRGINIEPMAHEHEVLCRERPDDINLQLALSDHVGHATLYEGPLENRGASTLSRAIAESYHDQVFTPVEIEVTTLAEVCRKHPARTTDFLKIDVEGHEAAVIRGADWDTVRPRVLIVEATEPNSPHPAHDAWEPLLVEHHYRCVLFDGLNRFYVDADDSEAIDKLGVPLNVFDEYEPWVWTRQIEHAKRHIRDLETARSQAEDWATTLEHEVQNLVDEARTLDPARPTDTPDTPRRPDPST